MNVYKLEHEYSRSHKFYGWVVLRVQDVFMCVMIINPTYRLRMMTEDVCHRRSQWATVT